MRPVASTFGSWSRGWGRIGVAVATFALGAAVALSYAPPALASWTQVSGSTFATGKSPSGVAFSPSGGLLAVTNDKSNTVSVFAVGSGGALKQVSGSPFATGIEPDAVAFSPNGALLAVANFDDGPEDTPDDGTVSVFAVGAGGALKQVSGSPFSTGRFTLPSGVAFSPSGRLLAVTNSQVFNGNTVSVFAVGVGGQLTPVSGSPFGTGFEPQGVAFSPSGGLLADTDGGYGDGGSDEEGSVTVFAVGSGGQLTRRGSPLPGKSPSGVAFSPSGGLLAYTNPGSNGAGHTVSVYAVGSGDALTQVSGSPFATGTDPADLAFSPTGGLLADANRKSNTVSVYAVGSGGLLTPISGSPFATGDAPVAVSFSPGGGLLAAANNGGNSVSVYAVGPPSVTTFTTPPNGATYTLGQVVDASYSCADDPEGPGIASCNAPVASGSPIDTSTAGPHSFTVTATSKDGQTAVVTHTYTVNNVLFGSPVSIPTGLSSPVALTLGDFDVTGREVVRTVREDIAAISSNAVSWIHGEGGGAFASPVVTKLPDSPKLSDIATLPGLDGPEYVAIADEAHDLIDVGFLSPTGFKLVQQVPVGCAPSQIATGDFTGEAGGDDFAVACAAAHEIAIVLATPPPRLGRNLTWAVSQTFTIPIVLDAGIATVLDNAAGGVDIVATGVSSFSDEGVTEEEEKLETLLPTRPPGTYVPSPHGPFLLRGVALTFPVATATATLDGRPTVIVASLGGSELPPLVDYLGNGDGTYAAGIPLPASSASEDPTALATGSFNTDSVPDLAVGERLSSGSCLITIDMGDGTGGFTAGPTTAKCGDVNDMKVGELNGEGLDDIAYTDPGDKGLFVLYQDPPQVVTIVPDDVVESQPAASAVGLLIQRRGNPHRVEVEVKTPTGTKGVMREVPTLITVGHVPLGPHHKGLNTIRYKLLVNGHPLAPGSYIVTLRSLNANGRVLDLSQPVALTVDRHGHARFGKHVLV